MRPPPRLQLFRGFLSSPLSPKPPQPPRPLFLSSSFPPFQQIRIRVYQQVCTLPSLISSFLYLESFLPIVFLHRSLPLAVSYASLFSFFLLFFLCSSYGLFTLERVGRSILNGYIARGFVGLKGNKKDSLEKSRGPNLAQRSDKQLLLAIYFRNSRGGLHVFRGWKRKNVRAKPSTRTPVFSLFTEESFERKSGKKIIIQPWCSPPILLRVCISSVLNIFFAKSAQYAKGEKH